MMDEVLHDNIVPQTEIELTTPPSPKRLKTDYAVINDHKFDSPKLLTFPESISSPSISSTLQKSEEPMSAAEHGGFQDENSHQQAQDTKLNVTPVTQVTTSHCRIARTGSPDKAFITAERLLLPLSEEEQPPVTETDNPSLCPGDNLCASSVLTSTDTLSHSYAMWPGKKEEETPENCSLPSGDDEDGRQVQADSSQIQSVTCGGQREEVTCQSDWTLQDNHTSVLEMQSNFPGVSETNQNGDELEFCETSVSEEEGTNPTRLCDHADPKTLCSNSGGDPPRNSTGAEKHAKTGFEFQICDNENVSVCDPERSGQVNETDSRKNIVSSSAECTEPPIPASGVESDRNAATEDVRFEADYFCGAQGVHAAGGIIARAPSEKADHTTEAAVAAGISGEPAEGDNDAGPFGVIDPAIWSEADREAEEKRGGSECAAGVELSPSVNTHEMGTLVPVCADVSLSAIVSSADQSELSNQQSRTWQGKTQEFCQSCAKPQACSIIPSLAHDTGSNESNCQWTPTPSRTPEEALPAGDGGMRESHGTVGHDSDEQRPASCFPGSPDHLETHEAENCQSENDSTAKIKENTQGFVDGMKSDEHRSPETEEVLQHKEDMTEKSSGRHIGERTEPETHEPHGKLKLAEGKLENKLQCSSDLLSRPEFTTMEVTIKEREEKEVPNVEEESKKTHGNENSETEDKSKADVKQENEHMVQHVIQSSPGGGISQQTEGGEVTLCSEDELQGDCSHTVDDTDDLLAFAFSPISDAVVPYQQDLNVHTSAEPNGTDRFSLPNSAFTLYCHVLQGFDTFEKIQLSSDGEENDDDILGDRNDTSVLTSSSEQRLEGPQLEGMLEGEEMGEEEAEEEEGENMGHGFAPSDELPNFISGAEVIALIHASFEPASDSSDHIEGETNPQFSAASTGSSGPACDADQRPDFEMKNQFDMVLKELSLFFDISREDCAGDCGLPSPERRGDVTKDLQGGASACQAHLSSPEVGHHKDASSDDVDEDPSLDLCDTEPVPCRKTVPSESEQEVPLSSNLTHTGTQQRGGTWSPSFGCLSLSEQLLHRQPTKRLEPLKTCTRPIRVGLSRRTKTKHLHCPHPYK